MKNDEAQAQRVNVVAFPADKMEAVVRPSSQSWAISNRRLMVPVMTRRPHSRRTTAFKRMHPDLGHRVFRLGVLGRDGVRVSLG